MVNSFSDRPATPQTSAPPTPQAVTLNTNMQSPRQNNTTVSKEPVAPNAMIRNTGGW